jgi:hypothetical protein
MYQPASMYPARRPRRRRLDDAYEMYWLQAIWVHPVLCRATLMFFGVLNHEVRPSQLFNGPRAARAAARALLDRPDQLIITLKEFFSLGKQNVRRARQRRMVLQS